MKNILIIAHGQTAQIFLKRVANTDLSKKRYFIVYYDDNTLDQEINEHFLLYKFDPTSTVKITALLNSHDFYQSMIVLSNKVDTMATYENIRAIYPEMQIVIHDRWQLGIDNAFITVVESRDLISNMLVNHLPDIPLHATNIGLGQGEVVEFKIPFGSPFTYRYISNIEQKRWKIVAIYREHKLLIPNFKTTIEPNDSILAIGNPNVLKSVYKSINREFGQFPIPFGENIYCYIDMQSMSDEEIEKLTNDAMLLHSNLNSNKLLFRVVNPRYCDTLNKIKSYDKGSMQVELDFHDHNKKDIINRDVEKYTIGMFITDEEFFSANISLLHHLKIPVLKIGKSSFFNIKESVALSNESEKTEKISSTIFDISSQFKLDISIYEFEGGESGEFKKVIDHFNNLSKLFEEKVKVIKTRRNPLRELGSKDNILQFLPFDESVEQKSIFSFFTKNINKLHFQLSDNYQIFLPSEE